MKKKVLILVLFLSFKSLVAQTTTQWVSHFSYNTIVDLKNVDNKLYVATTNSIFINDLTTNENRIFTTVDGLSGNEISTIFVASDEQLIFIGYENGLLETINLTSGEVNTFADITIQDNLPQDSLGINNFSRNDDIIYISTEFGIVEFSLSNNTFDGTFSFRDSIGNFISINDVTVLNNSIFAALDNNEIKQASLSSNLDISTSWSTIQNVDISGFFKFDNSVYGISNNQILEFDSALIANPFINNSSFSGSIKSFVKTSEDLTLITNSQIVQLNQSLNTLQNISLPTEIVSNVNFSSINGNTTYMTIDDLGLNQIIDSNFDEITQIGPSGPANNDIFKINAFEGDVWGVYGRYSEIFVPQTRNIGPSAFRNGIWENYESLGNLTDIIINPNNKNEVFVCAYRNRNGLYKFMNGELTTAFNEINSNLQLREGSTVVSSISGTYDNSGDLWVINNETFNTIKKFSEDPNDIDGFHVNASSVFTPRDSFFVDFLNSEEIVVDENQNFYIGSRRDGIIGYQESTNTLKKFDVTDNGESFRAAITALNIDLTNTLWVGTRLGLRIIPNAEGIFTDEVRNAENIVITDDNGIPQELLFQIRVTDIEVDAENNKWIGTNGSGVFFISPDGQQIFNVFTRTNSPLPSDNINDIVIDPDDGSVYIATDKGLMQFKSTVVEAEQNFDNFKIFPNPVRPEYGDVNVQIQGLTAGAVVKITDIEGNLVYEIENPVINGRGSGAVTWDTRTFSGRKVSSGVYLALITGKDGEQTKVGKLLIIR